MKKKAVKKRKNYPTKLERINVKLKKDVLATLQKKADRYAEGNLSAWLRVAGLKYVPKPSA